MEAFDGLLQLSTPLPPRPQSLTHSHQHLGPDCFRDQPLPSLCVVLSPRSCPCKEQISDLDSKQPITTSRFTTTTSGTRFTIHKYAPFLDGVRPPDAVRTIDRIRALDLAHLATLHFRWFRQFEHPLWNRRARLQNYVRDTTIVYEWHKSVIVSTDSNGRTRN